MQVHPYVDTLITKVHGTFQRSLCWFLLQTTRAEPWQRFPCKVPLHVYGAGSRHEFSWYLEGESGVDVDSIDDICAWLLTCRYRCDPKLFGLPDYWQHPCAFERLRQGDCEDYALWAWRKMIELDMDAEFVAGHIRYPDGSTRGHTWVLFRDADGTWLFDPVVCQLTRMILPLQDVANAYLPEVSVDAAMVRYAYGGYYETLRPVWLASLA
jgi:hypothetical protein